MPNPAVFPYQDPCLIIVSFISGLFILTLFSWSSLIIEPFLMSSFFCYGWKDLKVSECAPAVNLHSSRHTQIIQYNAIKRIPFLGNKIKYTIININKINDNYGTQGQDKDNSKSRVGHSVLFHSVRYVLLRSKKRTLRSFPFFSKVRKRTGKT